VGSERGVGEVDRERRIEARGERENDGNELRRIETKREGKGGEEKDEEK